MLYYLAKSGTFYKAPETFQNPLYFLEGNYKPKDVFESLALAEWLRTHTEKEGVKNLVIRYYATLAVRDEDYHGISNRAEILITKYNFPVAVIKEIYDAIHLIKITRPKNPQGIVNLLVAEFMQEFAAIDVQGTDVTVYCGAVGINWFATVKTLDLVKNATSITVCRAGAPTVAYVVNETPIYRLSYKEFDTLPPYDYVHLYHCKIRHGEAICKLYKGTGPATTLKFWRNSYVVETNRYYKEMQNG